VLEGSGISHPMKELIVWIDVGARLALGTLLVFVPRLTMTTFGLPKAAELFWPRMFGLLLLAVAAGAAIDVRWPGKGGPLLGGLVALNVAAAFGLATALVVGQLDIPKRGRLAMWLAATASAVLALMQLAWV
jgi:hypothetical protein